MRSAKIWCRPLLSRCYALLAMVVMLFCTCDVEAADKKFTLVIDAGHGGHDSGAVGARSKEKNINLSVALLFGKYVEKNCPDVKVIYTRTNDTFVTLQGRANIANNAKADLFVSVHTNSAAKGNTARGFEVYTLGMHRATDNLNVAKRENSVITLESDYKERYQGFDPNSSESYIMFEYMQDKSMENSVKFAKMVQNNVCSSAGRSNRGVHQAGFLVLRETSMPSVLIELGFISTPDEERQLNDAAVQDKIARGIFAAFQSYRGMASEAKADPVTVKVAEVEVKESTFTEEKVPTKVTNKKAPVFKVQIFGTSKSLKKSDARFKGLKGVDYYKEGGLYKYTYGSSNNYEEIANLRQQIVGKFPEAFVVAFKGNSRTDIKEAINEWRKNNR